MSTSSSVDTQAAGFKKLVDAVLEEAKIKSETVVKEALQKSNSILDESEKFAKKRSSEIITSYREMAEIDARKEVSKAEIESRMDILKLKESYVQNVLAEAKKKLESMVGTPEYRYLMLDGLKSASKSMKGGQVLINQRDIDQLGIENLKKAVGSGAEIKAQPVGTGGFIIIANDGKSSVDRTIDSILNSERQAIRGKIAELLFG